MRFIAPLTSLALLVAAALPAVQAVTGASVALQKRHEIPRCIVDCENKSATSLCGAEGIANAECWCKSQPFFNEAYECSTKCGLDLEEDVNHAWREIAEVCDGLQGASNSTATVPFRTAAGATPTGGATNSNSTGEAGNSAPAATSPPAGTSSGSRTTTGSSAPASTGRPDGAASVNAQLVLVLMTAVLGSALSML